MILVTGAGGKTGRAFIQAAAKREPLRGLSRRPEQIPELKALGAAQAIHADLRDEAALRTAMQGVRAVYHICPNMSPDELVIGKLVIGEARAARVGHFVYHSVLHPQIGKMPHHWQKLRVEELLFESGLPFTVLQPAPYMQNLLAGWQNIVEDGLLQVPYSVDSKFSFVDIEDVAEAVALVLTGPGHVNAIYELAGTLPVSHVEVAEIFSRRLNRDVRAEKEEIRDWRLRATAMSEYAVETLVRMFEYYDQWGLAGSPNALKWILKREPASFEKFIDRMLKEQDAIP